MTQENILNKKEDESAENQELLEYLENLLKKEKSEEKNQIKTKESHHPNDGIDFRIDINFDKNDIESRIQKARRDEKMKRELKAENATPKKDDSSSEIKKEIPSDVCEIIKKIYEHPIDGIFRETGFLDTDKISILYSLSDRKEKLQQILDFKDGLFEYRNKSNNLTHKNFKILFVELFRLHQKYSKMISGLMGLKAFNVLCNVDIFDGLVVLLLKEQLQKNLKIDGYQNIIWLKNISPHFFKKVTSDLCGKNFTERSKNSYAKWSNLYYEIGSLSAPKDVKEVVDIIKGEHSRYNNLILHGEYDNAKIAGMTNIIEVKDYNTIFEKLFNFLGISVNFEKIKVNYRQFGEILHILDNVTNKALKKTLSLKNMSLNKILDVFRKCFDEEKFKLDYILNASFLSTTPSYSGPKNFSEVFGLSKEIREELESFIYRFRLSNTKPPGLILSGPPGTGKTMLSNILAKETGRNFIKVTYGEWQASGHMGDTLKAMNKTFQEAREAEPSILFIDEIDSIGSRGREGNGGNDAYITGIINHLLDLLQGLDGKGNVAVIAATNHYKNLDPAIIRSGRLGNNIEIPYPDRDGIKDIIRFYSGNLDDKFIEDLSYRVGKCSPADIDELITASKEHMDFMNFKNQTCSLENAIIRCLDIKIKNKFGDNYKNKLKARAFGLVGQALYEKITENKTISIVSLLPGLDNLGRISFIKEDEEIKNEYGDLKSAVNELHNKIAFDVAVDFAYKKTNDLNLLNQFDPTYQIDPQKGSYSSGGRISILTKNICILQRENGKEKVPDWDFKSGEIYNKIVSKEHSKIMDILKPYKEQILNLGQYLIDGFVLDNDLFEEVIKNKNDIQEYEKYLKKDNIIYLK